MGGTVCSSAPAPSGVGDETEKGRKRKRKTDPVAAPPAAPAPSAHRSSERACPARPALRGRGRPKPGGGAANPARSRSTRSKSPPVLSAKELRGLGPTPSRARDLPLCPRPGPSFLPPAAPPLPNEAAPTLPAATPHFAPRCGLARCLCPGGGRPWQRLRGAHCF